MLPAKPRLLVVYPTLAVDRDLIPRTYQLLADRYDVTVVTPERVGYPDFGLPTRTLDIAERRLAYPDVAVEPVALVHPTQRILRTLYRPLAFVNVLRDLRPDLVHVYSEVFSPTLSQAILAARAACPNAKIVNYSCENIDWYRFPFSTVGRWNLRRLDAVYALNRDAETEIAKFGVARRMFRFGLGVELDRITYRPHACPAPSEPFTIGFVGRLVPEKGVDTLLRALSRLPRERFRAVIVGEWPDRADLEFLRDALAVDAEFVGKQPLEALDGEYFPKMDALVVPSRSSPVWKEQFGRVIAEGMAAGLPVVAARSGAIPEVVDRYGVLFEEDDEADLTARLLALADDPYRYERLSREANDYARANFSLDAFSRNLDDLYRAVLS